MPRKYYPKRTPKTLKRKNIKRKTGAKSQSKQIMALSKQIRSLTKVSRTKFNMAWQKPTGSIDGLTSTGLMYLCPINYMPSDPYAVASTNTINTWSDNAQIPTQQTFSKNMLFQAPDYVSNCKHIYHTGSVIKYQLTTNEPQYSKVNIALIRPKKKFADQLTIDRNLLGGPPGKAGSISQLNENVDFTVHNGASQLSSPVTDTVFGLLWNKQYWDVLYNREVGFSHPGSTALFNSTTSANTAPKNNAFIKTGYIRVPAGGVIANVSRQNPNPEVRTNTVNAIETSILDCRAENMCYLCVYSNGSSIDGETVQLAFRCLDSYVATN
jgi:hypothetical protein